MKKQDEQEHPDFIIPLLKVGAHGGTRVLVSFANHVAEQGWRVSLLAPKGSVEKSYVFDPHVTLREIGVDTGSKLLNSLLFLLVSPFYMRRGLLIANFFVTFFPVIMARRLFGCSYIYLVQDIETWFKGPLGFMLNLLCRLTWFSPRMVATSPHIAETLKKKGHPAWRELLLGVDKVFFASARHEEKSYDLIAFPRPEAWKRMDRLKSLIEAAEQKGRKLRILCVSQNEELLNQCRLWGCAVACPKTDEALVDCYDKARATLFTSEREGLGLPPLEGMARGLPAVVFANDGVGSYMKVGQNGFVVETVEQALSCVEALLDDGPLYESFSAKAKETAKGFATSAAFDDFLENI